MACTPEAGIADLTAKVLPQATVSPIQKARMEAHILHLGVFTQDGTLVAETTEDRHHGTHLYRAADLSIYPLIGEAPEPEAIYAGVFFNHFGHFLLESLARLWYAKDHPDLPIIWVGVDSWPRPPQLRSWQREILQLLGLRNPVRIVTRPERFSILHVPDAGYKYADWCHPRQARFLAVYDAEPQIPGRKIWLSRSNVANGVGIVNSDMIERHLKEAGWTIVCPEQLSIAEQLRTLANAEEIAGEEGSAFHSLLLLRDVSKKKFHVFRRHGPEHFSFHTIGNARQVNQSFHSTGKDAIISIAGRDVQRLAPNATQVLSSLRVPVRKSGVKDPTNNASVRRVRGLIDRLQARSYLEIGVRDGAVFNAVTCARKVALDTDFRFDIRHFSRPESEFYNLSAQDFATHFAKDQRFDVIFINNCHLCEEVMQSFTACLPLTHQRSVFLIDNVLPSDAFSALRDGDEALRQRHAQGNPSKAWHGDVYKAVFLLRTLFPAWQLATINSGGNPQALFSAQGHLAKYQVISPSDPSAGLAKIATLEYTGMLKRKKEFNFLSEEAALQSLRPIVRSQ